VVRQTTAFLADDDSMHTCECAAAKRNVELLVKQSPVDMHEGTRSQLINWFMDADDSICDTLLAYRRACPKAVAEKAG
jgi:hypothetical protein